MTSLLHVAQCQPISSDRAHEKSQCNLITVIFCQKILEIRQVPDLFAIASSLEVKLMTMSFLTAKCISSESHF